MFHGAFQLRYFKYKQSTSVNNSRLRQRQLFLKIFAEYIFVIVYKQICRYMNAFTCVSTLRIHVKIVCTDRLLYTAGSKSGKRERERKKIYIYDVRAEPDKFRRGLCLYLEFSGSKR